MLRTKITLFIFLTVALTAYSQKVQTFTFSTEDSFFLKELKAMIQEKDGKIVFEMLPEQVLKQDKFKNLDLKKGDEVLFINSKKVKSVKDLQEVYDALESGQEIKLGIQRGKERFFATLQKEDQPEGGKQMMIMGGGHGGKVIMDGKEVDLDSLKKSENIMIAPQKKKKDNE